MGNFERDGPAFRSQRELGLNHLESTAWLKTEIVMEYVELGGEQVPKIGIGTWAMRGKPAYRAMCSALELGYRHIDTAQMYGNEAEIGRALSDSGVPRSELFVVSKVRSSTLSRQQVLDAGRSSRELLGLDQIDLYLVHWPNPSFPIQDTMQGMNQLVQQGVTRLIGVSNFSVPELQAAQRASEAGIFTNQVPYYVGHGQPDLLPYCQQTGVLLTAYSPLGRGQLAGSRRMRQVAAAHGVSAAQVALRWLIQQPMVVAIPKASDPAHQQANLQVFDFELTEAEMLDLGRR